MTRLVLATSVAKREIQVADSLMRRSWEKRHLDAVLALDFGSVIFAHLFVNFLIMLSFHVVHNQWRFHFVNVKGIFVDLVIWLSF